MADEVKATTRRKTIPKAESQLESPGKLIGRALTAGETRAETEFRKRVQRDVVDPGTRADVLKAAGIRRLPGRGLTDAPAKAPVGKLNKKMKRQMDLLRAAGIPERSIQREMIRQFGAAPGPGRTAARRERFLRRKAAEKFGTPP